MTTAENSNSFISSFPSLTLGMAWPRSSRKSLPFPLDRDSLHSYYLARNAIYALAQVWSLRNQEILFPAYCHGVELETLLAAGVDVRFYPVGPDMRVRAQDIASLLSPRTRAVYLIHYLGFPGPVEEVSNLCRDRGLLLIEDCALALLSRLGDRPLGSFGDAAVFCFYKTLPVPNGGALLLQKPSPIHLPKTVPPSLSSTMAYTVTAVWRHLNLNQDGLIPGMLRKMRNSVRSVSGTLGIVPVGTEHFNPAQADLSMSRLCNWLIGVQDFTSVMERRRQNYLHLLNRLRKISYPFFDELPLGVCPLFYPIRTEHKAQVLNRLFEAGVEATNFWSAIPSATPKGMFPAVDRLRRTVIELPCHQDLTPQAIDRLADLVCRVWKDK